MRRPAPAHAVPREGLVGAHTTKREPEARGEEVEPMELEDVAAEPMGPGADVAPTKRAEERERTRHQLERDLGRVPAGEEGALRERRADDVTSDSLARAARAADRSVTGHDVPGRKG